MATILVVDDRATNRELARTVLGYGGHQVIEARDGAEALALAHARHPDLVLTDIVMPGMDGYELARELRGAPDTAQTPIVFYTANYLEAETRPFAQACGVARVLLKSGDPEILMRAIDEVLAEEPAPTEAVETAGVDKEYLRAVSAKLFDKAKALSATEVRFRLMADSSPVGIAFGDRHGSANYINARLSEIMGVPHDDLLGAGWLRCASEDHHEDILAVALGRGQQDTDHHYRGHIQLPDGTARWLNVRVRPVLDDDGHAGFVGTVDDVTVIVEADEQRLAAERQSVLDERDRATARLASLRTLAGGVAHDFNNILGSILAYEAFVSESVTDLVAAGRIDADSGRTLLGDLEQIRKGGQRAAGLTQQLLTFGSRKIINRSALDLNRAVRDSNDLLAPTIGAGIRVVSHLAPDLRPVLAEPTAVAQILLNLTLNAVQAMPDGGTLTFTTGNPHTAAGRQDATRPAPGGGYARLRIGDTGRGMTPQTLAHAIEPFFTTAARGLGSGLGLAIVYGLVNQLGGTLHIESAAERGTVVTIDLPATDQPVAAPPGASAPAGGTETILVAEDEDGIRATLDRSLTRAGYTVLVAANGAEALALAKHHPHPVHLLLSDVVMPDILGDELAARVVALRPDTRTLFMSGYAGDIMDLDGVLESGVTVLPKPFTADELLAAVRTAIGTPRGFRG